jgi:hypothetical protein
MRTITPGLLLVLGACVSAPPPARVTAPPRTAAVSYRFSVDGKPYEPTVLSLQGEPERPRPGDLIRIDDFLLVLGSEPDQRFSRGGKDLAPTLHLELGGGRRLLCAAKIGWSFEKERKVVANPLAGRSAAELRGLRGLVLDEWPAGIGALLAALDPERVALTITNTTAQGKERRFPPLPATLRHLRVREWSSEGIRDYAPLASLRALRFLSVENLSREPLDLRLLAGMAGLRVLVLGGVATRSDDALANLRELRVLDLAGTGVVRIEGVRAMRALRRLDLSRTRVEDLTPLDGLEALEEVDANLSRVAKLPRIPLPRLRRLALLGAPVRDTAVAELRREHPRCLVHHRWTAALRDTLAGADRLRARTGGTCHRRPALERTIFEVRGEAAVRGFLAQIAIEEGRSGFHCMCCGSESFEVYRGEALLGTIGFHHGRSLRWPGGWPADGALTDDSAERLVRWLADHGMPGPAQERALAQKRRRAADRRLERYRQILGAQVFERIARTRSLKEAVAIFAELGDEHERALVYLRLLGCDHGSWNHHAGLDDGLLALLGQVEKAALAKALAAAVRDGAARAGAARWAFGERKHASLEPRALRAALPALGREGLTHPRPLSRRRTLTGLGQIKDPAATRLLREVLAGKLAARPLPAEEEVEPDGSVSFTPQDSEVEEGTSEAAHAALLLARRKDRRSLPAIRALLAGADGATRKTLALALDVLTGKVPASQPVKEEKE